MQLKEALEHATFIENPDGIFYRMDSYDEENDVVFCRHEDSGNEYEYASEAVRGWRIYTLEVLPYV